jgi:hypothetical protein
MIHYLVTPGYAHTMRTFLDHWARELEPRVRIVTYDEALRAERLPLGTYIFSDLERLLPSEREIATHVWDQLNAAGARILNHPARTLRRYELLSMLHERGRNHFRVVRASDRHAKLRFPVFIREEGEHSGSLTRLIKNRRQLDEALVGAMFRGHRLRNLLVVEYLDTSDADGVFRKYSSFVVGGRVVPCHIDCSRGWVVKDTDIVSDEVTSNERRYLETNPHREWLEETFALAGVDYGRIDYGLKDGRPEVWEINTNPIVILHPQNYSEMHMPVKRRFAELIRPAFEAIDFAAPLGAEVRIEIPVPLFTRLDFEKRRQRWAHAHRTLVRNAKRSMAFRAARGVLRPLMTPISPFLARISRSRSARNQG